MRFLVAVLVISSTALPAVKKPAAKRSPAKSRETSIEKKRPPAVELLELNTHEKFILRPDAKGRFGPKQLRGWNRFLRCHYTGRVHHMAPRLASLLYETAKHFDFKELFVVAGYRAPKIARKKGNPKSPHKKGLACDFRVDGVPNTELRDFLRGAFKRVGVGYYPNSNFVHLDVRQKVSAFWIDYSGPGERARYSKSPEQDLMEEKAEAAEAPRPTPLPQLPAKPEGSEPQFAGSPGAAAPIAPAINPTTR